MQKQMVVFMAVVAVAFAAVAIGRPDPKPDKYKNVEGCYIEQLDEVIPEGQSRATSKNCMEYRCGKEFVQFVSCGAVAADPPLKVEQDLSMPYPDCCPRVVKVTDSKAEKTNKV